MRLLIYSLAILGITAMTSVTPPAAAQQSYSGGLVVADHPVAAQAGLEVLEQGGNAVDAAVATSFCLSVVRPYSCGIGGGGFMIVNLPAHNGAPKVTTALNYRETAPRSVQPDHFEKLGDSLASRFTGHAVAIPGTVAGLLSVLDQFGSLDRAAVLAPAIRAAEQGFAADAHYVETAHELVEWLEESPGRTTTHPFLWKRMLREGRVTEGDTIKLPEQARALRLIAEQGADAFYKGEIADAIIKTVQEYGGVMTPADLTSYKPSQVKPLRGDFRGLTILTMPPPSSGGIAILQMAGLLERVEQRENTTLGKLRHNSGKYVHLVAEAMKHAFADRAEWLGDAAFVSVPVDHLLSDAYLDSLAKTISLDQTKPPEAYGTSLAAVDDSGTSHFCVVDQWGGAVSCTETINLEFGSRLAVEEFGFFLNNEMDDFTTISGVANAFGLKQSDLNLPAPGKRPLSSMTPILAINDAGEAQLLVGASGGPRIITSTFQTLLNAIVFKMNAQDAVAAPRFHHQWRPNVLSLEEQWAPGDGQGIASLEDMRAFMEGISEWDALHRTLESAGHKTGPIKLVGAVQFARKQADGWTGAADPRKGGAAAGR